MSRRIHSEFKRVDVYRVTMPDGTSSCLALPSERDSARHVSKFTKSPREAVLLRRRMPTGDWMQLSHGRDLYRVIDDLERPARPSPVETAFKALSNATDLCTRRSIS